MSICLTAGAITAVLAVESFTLAWAHSVTKSRWEEDWRVAESLLVLDAAHITGSGAGMEAPSDATFERGAWHYRPALPAQATLRLTHSPFTAGYELCRAGHCQALADLLPGIDNISLVELRACAATP